MALTDQNQLKCLVKVAFILHSINRGQGTDGFLLHIKNNHSKTIKRAKDDGMYFSAN